MIALPDELLEQFERGNVLLFIGERVGRDDQGLALIDQLAATLAERAGVDPSSGLSFPEIAQVYQDKMGRQALVQIVLKQLDTLGDEPRPVHRLIAGLADCKLLVTTGLDGRLERAFREAGRPLDVIVTNVDVAFEDERNAQLYKLRGALDQIESLLLTEDDYETFFEDQASISVVLQGYLVRKTILFVGYDLADPNFKRLFRKVTALLDDFARRAYAFGATPSPITTSWCKRHGIEVVEIQPRFFLEALTSQLASRSRPVTTRQRRVEEAYLPPIPERPYKLLDFYEAKDAAIFFGRSREINLLTSLIHAHRLVVLYGTSGVGKTSLLLAGCQPRLQQADPAYEIVLVRALEDPAIAIRTAIRRRLPAAELPADGAMVGFLDAATKALQRPLVIVLDQFEEFFLRLSSRSREAFVAELGALQDARDLPVKVVISLREDWLASMSEFERRIPEIFRTKMRLLPLTRNQAQEAITAPVDQLGMHYDPEVLNLLFADLADAQLPDQNDPESAAVMPPQLQLVCDALYQRAHVEQRQRITVADYQAIGGAQGILKRYIETALEQHPGPDKAVARAVLLALVTSHATKGSVDAKDLAAEVGTDDAMIERVLSRLIGARLVRRQTDGQAYELAHDILAATIASWTSEEDRQLKQTRELLRRELADWQSDRAMVVSHAKYQRVNKLRERLKLDDEAKALLLTAAVAYGEDVAYWLGQVEDSAVQEEILLAMLASSSWEARQRAAQMLAERPATRVAPALAKCALEDPVAAVRAAAATSLGWAGGEAGVGILADAALDKDSPRRVLALQALVVVADSAGTKAIPTSLRNRVRLRLAALRLRRHRSKIGWFVAAGALGGAASYGLGLTVASILFSMVGTRGATKIVDLLWYTFIFASLGALAGAGLGLGMGLGESLMKGREGVGRMLGGALLGGLSFALTLGLTLLLTTLPVSKMNPLSIPAAGLVGVLIALGATIPAQFGLGRAISLLGGTLGGVVGVEILGLLDIGLFDHNYPARLLLVGVLIGLPVTASLVWAVTRRTDDSITSQPQPVESVPAVPWTTAR